ISSRKVLTSIYTPSARANIPEWNAYQPFQLSRIVEGNAAIDAYRLVYGTWLVSGSLPISERLSMASSVELRMPLLDYRLIEKVVGLSKVHRPHDLAHKSWLRAALRGTLSDEILDRPKRGFEPPTREWMRRV